VTETAAHAAAARRLLCLGPDDNVAVALADLPAGSEAVLEHRTVTVLDDVPAGHKVALAPIRQGAVVVKYGVAIGRATAPIEPGRHVHVHNVESERLRGDR
jgi:altronate dehydratase